MKNLTKISIVIILMLLVNTDNIFSQQWTVVPSPNPSTIRNILRGVGSISTNDVWAVGEYDQQPSSNLAMHWNGTSWTVVSTPNPGLQYNALYAVKGISSNNFYAVGSIAGIPATSQMQILHWNGSTWTQENTPTVTGGSALQSILIFGTNDIYAGGFKAVGAPGPTTGTLVIHWNGSSWNIEDTPNQSENRTNRINDMKGLNSNDIWAVGYSRRVSENFQAMVLHKTGSSWNVVPVPQPGLENFLESIDIISSNDIWVSGSYNDGITYQPLFMHYNGSSWTVVASPGGGYGLQHNSPNDIWSTGSEFVHYDGSVWSSVSAAIPPGGGMGSSTRISSTDMWAVGNYYDLDIPKTLTMHFGNGPSLVLNLSSLIQGFYDPSINKMVSDTSIVYLRNTSAPYSVVDSSKSILDSNGAGSFTFSNAVNGTPYYIVVTHRNSIETWSAAGQSFTAGNLTYNFTSSSSQAYGNNLVLKGSKYCIYSGDVNQDDAVDATDLIQTYNASSIFSTGYLNTDINGDNFTDISDLILAYNNSSGFVSTRRP
ncbi:MAG: hypothetical protein ABIO41_11925 [Ignavibacteria bacterium]